MNSKIIVLLSMAAFHCSEACHIVIKGIASVLRENVCFDKISRQCLNNIIHCPNFTQECKTQQRYDFVIHSKESIDFMIESGFYKEILKMRKQ